MKQVNKWETVRAYAFTDLMSVRRAYKKLDYDTIESYSMVMVNYAALGIISQLTQDRYFAMRAACFNHKYNI